MPPALTDARGTAVAVKAYGDAWASRDVAKILALHTPDTEFVLVVDGVEAAVGREAVRGQFEWVLSSNPAYAARTTAVDLGADLAVIEYAIRMAPTEPFVMGRWRYTPTGSAYEVRAFDVLRFRDGLVRVKHTYLDVDAIRRNSRSAVAVPVP